MSTGTKNFCCLCEQPTEHFKPDLRLNQIAFQCSRCGTFAISVDVVLPPDKHLLSYVCRTWPDGFPTITNESARALLQRAPLRTIPEKRDWLLQLLGDRTRTSIGKSAAFDGSTDYPLVTARNLDELVFLLDALKNAGLIHLAPSNTGTVTMAGWERISQLRQAGPNSAFAFVAMSFAPQMNALFDDAIFPAVTEAGYRPFRVDRKEHANSIDDEIVANIRKSRFMVADFTGQRAGVYFEAGMMNGLGRTVIWMCKKEELEKVHFDVRQRNFIDWASVEDARKRLYDRIRAIEGEGPNLPVGA
jgi:hypothetical protein